jgi:outer membrane protein OmpA-like peptidoglycan-associated protein
LNDALNAGNERQLQQLSEATVAERDDRRRQSVQQDDLLRHYVSESASLKDNIQRLQRSVNTNDRDNRGGNTILPVVILPAQTQQLAAAPVRSIKDTVYLKDTIRIRDTLTLTKKEILDPVTVAVPVTAPIEKVTVIKQAAFDYTSIPADIILFELGKATLQPVYQERMDYIAGILMHQPGLQASITGHTDKSGSPEINKILSLKRAQNVTAYLVEKGVAPSSLRMDSVYFLEPAVAGNSRSASSQNRRVVIKIINK